MTGRSAPDISAPLRCVAGLQTGPITKLSLRPASGAAEYIKRYPVAENILEVLGAVCQESVQAAHRFVPGGWRPLH
ncbi:hypothetical protein A5657_08980 [Mycobacterium kubicae]|nr:hypothetical protein A5657_08980 [Mycobacterium kubicae]